MFIQLKSHKAHVFTKNDIDPSKSMFPGAMAFILTSFFASTRDIPFTYELRADFAEE